MLTLHINISDKGAESTDEWARGMGVKYSYTVELRDDQGPGHIQATGEDTFHSLVNLLYTVR